MGTSRAPKRREIQIGEGEGLSGGNSSVHSSIKLCAYAGRLANLNLSGINSQSHNLTTVYLYTPLVGPKLDPLEYIPSPIRLGQPSGYPPTSTGAYIGGSRRLPSPPPLPYHTHPRMHPSTVRAQPRRVMQPATGHEICFETLATRGEPLAKFWPQSSERPNPLTHAYGHRGGSGKQLGSR